MMLKGHPRSMYKYWDSDSHMQSKTQYWPSIFFKVLMRRIKRFEGQLEEFKSDPKENFLASRDLVIRMVYLMTLRLVLSEVVSLKLRELSAL